ncbi:MAG TPA: nitroreductase/quinone reductase family protein [Streptosporangiaceae bacterium]|nr:nitroreductase/quinone reductase family protein [Streptosporangiaceae bacterium]
MSAESEETGRRPRVLSIGRRLRRVANLVVSAILRSRWHRLLSGSLALLTVTGRRTGRRQVFPVRYAESGKVFIVLAGGHEQKTWWRNLAASAPVLIRVAGCDIPATAEVSAGDERPWCYDALRAYFTRFPKSAARHGLRPNQYGSFAWYDLKYAARQQVVVRVVPVGVTLVPTEDAWMDLDIDFDRFQIGPR